MSEIVYKVLGENGDSPNAHWKWPLPDDIYDFEPSDDWLELGGSRKPEICAWGFHGWQTEERALREKSSSHPLIFEMEIEGDIVSDSDKRAGRRARLLRLLFDREGMVVNFADYVWQ